MRLKYKLFEIRTQRFYFYHCEGVNLANLGKQK